MKALISVKLGQMQTESKKGPQTESYVPADSNPCPQRAVNWGFLPFP